MGCFKKSGLDLRLWIWPAVCSALAQRQFRSVRRCGEGACGQCIAGLARGVFAFVMIMMFIMLALAMVMDILVHGPCIRAVMMVRQAHHALEQKRDAGQQRQQHAGVKSTAVVAQLSPHLNNVKAGAGWVQCAKGPGGTIMLCCNISAATNLPPRIRDGLGWGINLRRFLFSVMDLLEFTGAFEAKVSGRLTSMPVGVTPFP
jgi:hypothetical protein